MRELGESGGEESEVKEENDRCGHERGERRKKRFAEIKTVLCSII